MNVLFLPLVNWGMGAVLIGVFALVCIVMVAVVMSLTNKLICYGNFCTHSSSDGCDYSKWCNDSNNK